MPYNKWIVIAEIAAKTAEIARESTEKIAKIMEEKIAEIAERIVRAEIAERIVRAEIAERIARAEIVEIARSWIFSFSSRCSRYERPCR